MKANEREKNGPRFRAAYDTLAGLFWPPPLETRGGSRKGDPWRGPGRLQHGKTPIDPFPRTWGHTTCALERGSTNPRANEQSTRGRLSWFSRLISAWGVLYDSIARDRNCWKGCYLFKWNLYRIREVYMRLTLQRGELKKNSFDVYSNFKSHRPVLRSTFHIWGGKKKERKRKEKIGTIKT